MKTAKNLDLYWKIFKNAHARKPKMQNCYNKVTESATFSLPRLSKL